MASGLSCVVVLAALCVALAPCVYGDDRDCESYKDVFSNWQDHQSCRYQSYCCGSCLKRYCCKDSFYRFTKDNQEDCEFFSHSYSPVPIIIGVTFSIVFLLICICCCVCPCCCLYKLCRKPRSVIATNTHTTVVTSVPQNYPQQPTGTPYQGAHYQHMPVQPGYAVRPGYGAQPGYAAQPQGYGAQQPMAQGYGPAPMSTTHYHGQPLTPGPPPTYQEATGPGPSYPPNPMPYSQAAFSPGQPSYPMQPPPTHPQPNAPMPTHTDFLAQPAFNPDFVSPPPKTG